MGTYVPDINDKTGFGMYSNVGRYLTIQHDIFKKKDEILYDQHKYVKVRLVNSLPSDVLEEQRIKDTNLNMVHEITLKKKPQSLLDGKKIEGTPREKQPFFKSMSRDKMNQIHGIKCCAPPIGVYNPKKPYAQTHILRLYSKETNKHIPRISSASTVKNQELSKEINISDEKMPLKISSKDIPQKIKGYVTLSQQNSQSAQTIYAKEDLDPEGKKFNLVEIPSVSSRYKRPYSFKIDKTSQRSDKPLMDTDITISSYKPNFEFGKKRVGSAQLRFDKMASRRPMSHISSTVNEDFYDYNHYAQDGGKKSQILKKVSSPNFNTTLSRNQLKLGYFTNYLVENKKIDSDSNEEIEEILE